MKSIRDSRQWILRVGEDKTVTISSHYTLYFKDGDKTISDIRNQFGFSVEKESECWEYFTKKYSNHL